MPPSLFPGRTRTDAFKSHTDAFLRRISPGFRSARREVANIEAKMRQIPGVTDVTFGMVGMTGGVHQPGFVDFEPGFFIHTNVREWVQIKNAASTIAGRIFRTRMVVNGVEQSPAAGRRPPRTL